VVVGWSIGGVIALEAAMMRPDLAVGLVLIEPPLHAKSHPSWALATSVLAAKAFAVLGSPHRATTSFYGWALRRRSGASDLARMDAGFCDRIRACAPAIVRELDGGTGEHLGRERLAQIRCPVSIIVGDDSHPDFTRAAERLSAIIPGATMTCARGSGHCVQVDRPDVVEEVVLRTMAGTAKS
jgi:pimeloyl-ACP methyl ester carboxylesterase